jgi:hypothetical protein
MWRRGRASVWPDPVSISPDPRPLTPAPSYKLWEQLKESIDDSKALISERDLAMTRACLAMLEREKGKPITGGVARPRVNVDPCDAGFSSESAREWREAWKRAVLLQTSLKYCEGSPKSPEKPPEKMQLPVIESPRRSPKMVHAAPPKAIDESPSPPVYICRATKDLTTQENKT